MITYKPHEFAKLIGVSIRTLQRWDMDSKLIAKRSPSNRRYYTHDQYEAYVNQNLVNDKTKSFIKYISHLLTTSCDQLAMIEVDINGLKTLNATYGETVCNQLINKMRCILTTFIGDERCILNPMADIFTMITSYTSVQSLIRSIEAIDKKLIDINPDILYCMSWGIYLIKNRNETVLSMMDKTTIARKSVKRHAIDNIGLFVPCLQDDINRIQLIENKMAKALRNNEFALYLQPKYDLSNNRMNGAEALIRWIESDGSVIEPSDFIPIFEQNGFVIRTDRFVWEEVCKTLKKWKDENLPLVPISINVSRRNLLNDDFTEYLTELMNEYQIDKNLIEIEITESFDAPINESLVKQLKKNGFRLLMDDFGAGYSSLNHLHKTDFDIIKLDKEFLSKFMESNRGRMIVQRTISMIKDINLNIVAEGVETPEQARFLEDHGCDTAQGFLYSKPLPVPEFEKLLLNEKRSMKVGTE